ncbi:MAG: hypothetical protein HC804_01365 [Anaerolineae bacterium]|nr:hypothetical protein [Anaerolineae bacterium]
MNKTDQLKQQLQERILIIDGAMGSLIQTYGLDEAGYRGERFANHPQDIKGNNEVLNLVRPDIIHAIHTAYLEAGADIVETNTFNGNCFSLGEYQMEEHVYEINREAARIAKQAVADFGGDVPKFVAGALGPSTALFPFRQM